MNGALTRYRVIAYVVGVLLVALTAGSVLKWGFGEPFLVETIGMTHGFAYMVYLAATYDLGRRIGWPIARMILVMLAGTVPFVSFVAERKVTRQLRGGRQPAPARP